MVAKRAISPRIGIVALIVAGVGVSVAACGGGAAAAGPATSSTSTAPTSSAPKRNHDNGVTGQITAENGNSWSITTKAGKQITVTLTSTTKFGTTQQPATEQQFPVGDTVHVTGTLTGTTVTATRIDVPVQRTSGAPSAPPMATTTA